MTFQITKVSQESINKNYPDFIMVTGYYMENLRVTDFSVAISEGGIDITSPHITYDMETNTRVLRVYPNGKHMEEGQLRWTLERDGTYRAEFHGYYLRHKERSFTIEYNYEELLGLCGYDNPRAAAEQALFELLTDGHKTVLLKYD
jgi:hypothetical protein